MSNDLMSAIRFILSRSWQFFTETNVPGTSFSIASLFLCLLLVDFGMKFIGWVLAQPAFDVDTSVPEHTFPIADRSRMLPGRQKMLPKHRSRR